MSLPDRPITILIAALGGEGGGVMADWLIDVATRCGYPSQSTSIPGVAQRTGATTYYLEIFPATQDQLAGRHPVLSLTPSPGNVDVMVASELIEAGRAMQNGFVSPERTTLVASTHRIYATVEKMQMGDGRFDSDRVVSAGRQLAKRAVLFDMRRLAQDSGTVINAVLFGAMAGSGVLPLPREACEEAIRRGGRGAEASLRGFAAGFDIAAGSRATRFARVRKEVGAREGEPVVVIDYLKPGVEELASLLPPFLGGPLLRWAEKNGKLDAYNIGMHVKTSGVLGYLMVRSLAWLKPWRPYSFRYREEQALIGRWLASVGAAAARSPALALEVAQCATLLKGYGETHRRGKANFLAIMDALVDNPAVADAGEQARAIRKAREAALADPEGKALGGALGKPVTWLKPVKS